MKKILFIIAAFLLITANAIAQESEEEAEPGLEITGSFMTDQRLLTKNNNWAWNENRLTVNLKKNITGNSSFYSEIWFRNMGIPQIYSLSDLYNKGIVDPYNIEIRQAYVQVTDFLVKNLDITAGRQFINWGTADKINPTNNLMPYDFEDILDFGRHRGTDAVKIDYYLNSDFLLEGVFVPFFRPANFPVGIFSNVLDATPALPQGLTMKAFTDTIAMPAANLSENMTAGLRFKGFVAGFDFSVSYVYGRDYLLQPKYISIIPVDMTGGVSVSTTTYFPRQNIFGFDMAGNVAGVGVWAEMALFKPIDDIIMTTDLSALYPMSPTPVVNDSVLIAANEPYLKYVVGADYSFSNGIYTNIQYIHGFLHERGNNQLNDYFFLRVDKGFFYDKLKVAPISGAFIISDYGDLKNNYAVAYVPEIIYKPVDNAEFTLSAAIFDGKGENMFANFKDYSMIMLKLKYSF